MPRSKPKKKFDYHKVIAFVIVVVIVCFIAFILSWHPIPPPQNTLQPSNSTAVSNPASNKCVKDGGQDKVLMGPNGQYGLCLFPDGSVCDEWAYYQGNCSKGECMRKCEAIGTRSEGWYDCHGNLLFWDNCSTENATTAGAC